MPVSAAAAAAEISPAIHRRELADMAPRRVATAETTQMGQSLRDGSLSSPGNGISDIACAGSPQGEIGGLSKLRFVEGASAA